MHLTTKNVGWLLALALPLLTLFLLARAVPAGFDVAGSSFGVESVHFLAIVILALVMWVFRLVPDFIPAMLVILLTVLFDIVPKEIAISGFTSDVFFLVLGVFLFSATVTHSGIMRRLALTCLNKMPARVHSQNYLIFVTGIILNLIIPSPMGRGAILQPLSSSLSPSTNRQKTALILSNIHGNTLLSTIFLTGNPLNFVLLGLLDIQTQLQFQWLHWLTVTSFVALVLLIGFAIFISFFLLPERAVIISKQSIEKELTDLGKLNQTEWPIIGAFAFLAIMIATQNYHHISLPWIMISLAIILASYSVLTMEQIKRFVDWPTLLFISAIVSWGPIMSELHIDKFIANQLTLFSGIFQTNYFAFTILQLSVIIFVLRLFIPGAPAFILMLSTFLPFAQEAGYSGWLIGFIILTLSEGFIFTHQHGVFSQSMEMAKDNQWNINSKQLFLSNFYFYVLKVIALIVSIPLWQMISVI